MHNDFCSIGTEWIVRNPIKRYKTKDTSCIYCFLAKRKKLSGQRYRHFMFGKGRNADSERLT